MECGPVRESEFVGPHGQAAPLLKSIDASLDDIALLVRLSIKGGRAASGTTSPEAVSNLVGRLRDNRSDSASAQIPADGAGGVRAVGEDHLRSGSGSPRPGSRDPNPGHDRCEGRRVSRLTCGDMQGERPCLAVTGQMDLRAQAAAGASERVIVGFGAARRPLFLAPAACWWARHTVESTATVQPKSSAMSAQASRDAKIRSQVPSSAHLISRLCAVLNEPSSWADPSTASRCGTSMRWPRGFGDGRPIVVHEQDRPASAARSGPTSSVITNRTDTSDQRVVASKRHALGVTCLSAFGSLHGSIPCLSSCPG